MIPAPFEFVTKLRRGRYYAMHIRFTRRLEDVLSIEATRKQSNGPRRVRWKTTDLIFGTVEKVRAIK